MLRKIESLKRKTEKQKLKMQIKARKRRNREAKLLVKLINKKIIESVNQGSNQLRYYLNEHFLIVSSFTYRSIPEEIIDYVKVYFTQRGFKFDFQYNRAIVISWD